MLSCDIWWSETVGDGRRRSEFHLVQVHLQSISATLCLDKDDTKALVWQVVLDDLDQRSNNDTTLTLSQWSFTIVYDRLRSAACIFSAANDTAFAVTTLGVQLETDSGANVKRKSRSTPGPPKPKYPWNQRIRESENQMESWWNRDGIMWSIQCEQNNEQTNRFLP